MRMSFTSVLLRGMLGELVEYVKASLVGDLTDNARLFKEVVVDVGADGFSLRIELDFKVLAESRRVVVS